MSFDTASSFVAVLMVVSPDNGNRRCLLEGRKVSSATGALLSKSNGKGGQNVESRRSAGGSLPRWSSADGSKEGEGKLHVRVMCVIASML